MRASLILLVLAPAALGLAAPATAQPFRDLELARDAQAQAAAVAARNRDIALSNELSNLQARLQTDEALNHLQAQRISPPVPMTPFDPKAPPPKIDLSQMASIPDAALAQSNARVRAAADNRR
jgi:type IV secretory pathway VirJ component